MADKNTVLIYGTNMGGYRALYALCKKGYKTILLNQGSYVDEKKNQLLSQYPLDFCWICGHMPQRMFKALGCLTDNYNAELLEVTGEAGNFTVKFKKKDQVVNNFACTECDKCIEVCPVEVEGQDRKAISVIPHVGWENIYLIDFDHCTKCGECEKVCPTGALKLDRPEEMVKAEVGAIILAPEFDQPTIQDLERFGLGDNPSVVTNHSVAKRSLLTNFIQDSIALPSGRIPERVAIVVTPHFNRYGVEFENPNLCTSAVYRGLKIKEAIPGAQVTIFFRDYRASGKSHWRLYKQAVEAGIRIVRTGELDIVSKPKEAIIEFDENGKRGKLTVDLTILVTGQKPPEQMEHLSKICGVKADENGFCHIRPFAVSETEVDGIFAVGEFTGPKGNPETIWDGCASLTECLEYLGEKSFKPPAPPSLRNTSGEIAKVGVFICSCFGKFSENMDLTALEEKVKCLPGVSHAQVIDACCTPPTMKATAEKIKASGVNRVVLAVCTPLQKLLKYRKTVMMAGLNPLLSDYIRFREDVIYVHEDPKKMQTKALALINGGVERVKHSSQAPPPMDGFTSKVVVIGGGMSGMICATKIANDGFEVFLVECEEKLGGGLKYLEKEERSYVQDLIKKVEADSKITISANSRIMKVDGYAGNFHITVDTPEGEVDMDVGMIIVATGAKEYQPEGFLYGEDPRVVTQTELDTKNAPQRVAMIQCVGSKNEKRPFCSRICCNQALKNALKLREKGSDVTIFYRDITSCGREDYYQKAVDAGVRFVRFDEQNYPEVVKKGERLEVIPSNGGTAGRKIDLVVLSTGIMPDKENNEELSQMLGLPLDADGFFDSDANAYPYEEAIKRQTKPFELATNGIFAVGLAHSPRTFTESLLIAKDAAGRALVLLGKPKLPPPNAMYLAEVKESMCMGCGICVDVCPYKARYVDPNTNIAVIRPYLCDSCGSCVAACPNGATFLRDFKPKQSIAVLDTLVVGA